VLDVGCGPGLLVESMAQLVSPSGRVCAVDNSEPMLALATAHCSHQPWVSFMNASATQLPYPDSEFDICVSTQVLEYVQDVDTALHQIYRCLKPGGRVLIMDTDWDSIVWNCVDASRMARLLRVWNEHVVDPFLPRKLVPKLRGVGFKGEVLSVIPIINLEWNENNFSHGLITFMANFCTNKQGVTVEEVNEWKDELTSLSKSGNYFMSLNRFIFAATK